MADEIEENLSEEKLVGGDMMDPPLTEDHDTPFTEADDAVDETGRPLNINPIHQATDNASDIDSHQLYDEGLGGAAEASEPNAGSAVEGYDPAQDHRDVA